MASGLKIRLVWVHWNYSLIKAMIKLLRLFIFVLAFTQYTCAQVPDVRPKVLNPDFDQKISNTISFSIPVIGPDSLHKIYKKTIILDAREWEEYQISHLPGSQYIGYKDFTEQAVSNIPKDKTVVLYCSIGYRSEKIGEQMKKMGYQTVYNLYGSIFEWVNQGYPIVDDKGNITKKLHAYNKNWSRWVEEDKAEKIW